MSMNRVELMGYAWGRLGVLFTEVGMTNDDSSGNMKEPLDDTLMALGSTYEDAASAVVATADERAARALVRYYGLIAIQDSALNYVDESKSTGAPSVSLSRSRSQFVAQIEKSLERAYKDAAQYLPIGGGWIENDLETGAFLYDGAEFA